MTHLDINQIKQILPHRYPFLMIDKVLEIKSNQSLVAIKNITINEPFFQGHFPGKPIMPGVLMLEAMAQAAGILISYDEFKQSGDDWVNQRGLSFFAGINGARFKRIVEPGDQLHLEVELVKTKNTLSILKSTASVDEQLACEAELKLIWKKD